MALCRLETPHLYIGTHAAVFGGRIVGAGAVAKVHHFKYKIHHFKDNIAPAVGRGLQQHAMNFGLIMMNFVVRQSLRNVPEGGCWCWCVHMGEESYR